MASIDVLSVSIDENLQPFSTLLRSRGIAHRIYEEGGTLKLSVDEPGQAELVRSLYQAFQQGEVSAGSQPAPVEAEIPDYWFRVLIRSPLTLLLLAMAVPGALIGIGQFEQYQQALTFVGYTRVAGITLSHDLSQTLGGEYWRLLTPIFLHFTLLHIVFNGVFIWVFGHRIEILQGSSRLLMLVLLIGIGSNYAQYLSAPAAVFGGLSGVLYGLIGYLWGWRLLRPTEQFGIPSMIIYAVVGLMLLTATGMFTAILGNIANTAHIVGLLIGGVLGLVFAALKNRAA